jgi:transcriptional regulator with XRE-family HTH domain
MFKTTVSKHYVVFAAHLRRARREVKMTQVELAKRLGITQSMVSKCERGERTLDVVQLRSWCKALRVSFREFAARLDDDL